MGQVSCPQREQQFQEAKWGEHSNSSLQDSLKGSILAGFQRHIAYAYKLGMISWYVAALIQDNVSDINDWVKFTS